MTQSAPNYQPWCTFCRIASGEAPAKILYQDNRVTAFHDIHPQAPVHVQIIPNRHIPALTSVKLEDTELMGHLIAVANQLAVERGIAQSGYRLVINNGPHAGQSVSHLHLHLLGGRLMGWPPG